MKSRKVLSARLHTRLFVPGIVGADVGDVLPPNNKTFDRLDMSALGEYGIEGGLLIKLKFKNVEKTILIPAANVKDVTLAPEEA